MALRWIAANAEHFGGDPENITVFGSSAGGASVHYQLTSSFGEGLFHKAIIQSGSRLNPWANRPAIVDFNTRLAERLGWDGESDMLELLMAADASDIVIAQNVVDELDKQNGRLSGFVPTVEPYNNGSCMIDEDYLETYKTAWGNQVPVLIGGCSDEGYLMFRQMVENEAMFDDMGYFENAIPWEMNIAADSDERRELGEELRHFYYGDEEPSLANLDTYAVLRGDKLFWHGIFAAARARVQDESSAATYMYRFNFDSMVLDAFKMMMCGKKVEGKECSHFRICSKRNCRNLGNED